MHLDKIEELSEIVNQQIKSLMEVERRDFPIDSKTGYISWFADGIAIIDGLGVARIGQKIRLPESTKRAQLESYQNEEIFGQVMDISEYTTKCIIFGEERFIKQGDKVVVLDEKETVSVFFNKEILGQVIDPFGRTISEEVVSTSNNNDATPPEIMMLPIEAESASIAFRAAVNRSLYTGIKAVDTALPVGKGQRMLIIGDRGTGKTSLAISILLSQAQINKLLPKNKRKVLIYVGIAKKISEIAGIYNLLSSRQAMEDTIIVASKANDPASLVYISPFAATSIAEYYQSQGRESVIIYDDLTSHANAYRHLSLLLGRPPGREAYPGDIFYLHARLLERSGNVYMKKQENGSYERVVAHTPESFPVSITSFPIVQTKDSDFSAYIPTNIISITDGQIYLDTELAQKKVMPAVNLGLSVSRIGSAAQSKLVKAVSKSIKYDIAIYFEKLKYASFGFDIDKEDQIIINHGHRLIKQLKQSEFELCSEKNLIIELLVIYLLNLCEILKQTNGIQNISTINTNEQFDKLSNKLKLDKLNDNDFRDSDLKNLNELKTLVINNQFFNEQLLMIEGC